MLLKKDKKNKYLIFNINTTEISSAFIYFDNKREKVVVEHLVKSKLFFGDKKKLQKFKTYTMDILEKNSKKMFDFLNSNSEIENLSETFVFLSNPWSKKELTFIEKENKKDFLVSQNFLENFLKDTGEVDSEILINSEINFIKANGYDISLNNLVGKKISNLKISFLNSFVEKNIKEEIEEKISKLTGINKVNFSAFLPVLLDRILKHNPGIRDFAFMDFMGEIMEFGIFENGKVKNIFSFKFGKNKILRDLVEEKISSNESEAEYMFSLYLKKMLEKEDNEKIEKIIKKNKEELLSEIERKNDRENKIIIPKKVFIVSSGQINFLFKEIKIFEEVIFMGKSSLNNFLETKKDENFDNFIALEADHIFE